MSEAQESGEPGRETTVFFSYSRADKARALPIIHMLEQAGFAVWWDGVLEAGVRFVEISEDALDSARAVIVLWSQNSVNSNWVRDEATVGRDLSRLLPISLDGSLPPLGFRQFQALDFSGWKGNADAPVAQELLRATRALHEGRSRPPVEARPQALVSTTRRGLLYLGLGGAVTLGGTYALVTYLADGSATQPDNSIAVMPFRNDSQDGELDYLANGIATELRSVLARNPALRVIARSTSEAMEQSGQDALSIARELGVAFIVEGAVRTSGEILRVSSDLIEGDSGTGRWSHTYDQPMDELIDLQERLANAISTQLSLEVTEAEGQLQLGAATNPASYDEYLRA